MSATFASRKTVQLTGAKIHLSHGSSGSMVLASKGHCIVSSCCKGLAWLLLNLTSGIMSTGSSLGAVVWPLLLANLPPRSQCCLSDGCVRPLICSRLCLDLQSHGAYLPFLRHPLFLPPQNTPSPTTIRILFLSGRVQESAVYLCRDQLLGRPVDELPASA